MTWYQKEKRKRNKYMQQLTIYLYLLAQSGINTIPALNRFSQPRHDKFHSIPGKQVHTPSVCTRQQQQEYDEPAYAGTLLSSHHGLKKKLLSRIPTAKTTTLAVTITRELD